MACIPGFRKGCLRLAIAARGGLTEIHLLAVTRVARLARLRVLAEDLPAGSRHEPDRTLGVVAPADRICELVVVVLQSGHLILEPSSVGLVDDGRRDEDEQIALRSGVDVLLEEIPKDGDVAENWDLRGLFAEFVLQQTADGERATALD